MNQIIRIKIIDCSYEPMWYRDHIGMVLDCELIDNRKTIFAPYCFGNLSYKAIEPVEVEVVDRFKWHRSMLIHRHEPIVEKVLVGGWVLTEDVEIIS